MKAIRDGDQNTGFNSNIKTALHTASQKVYFHNLCYYLGFNKPSLIINTHLHT
jgi:hypothetical protein